MSSPAPRDLTVFVVDDDASVRDSLALMLGLAGYRTALYASAEAFLEAFRPDWVGCLIADLRLPGRSGIELQAELRSRGSTLPVIIITAHGDVPTARTAFQGHAMDFIEKPFDQGQLRAAIETAFALEQNRIRQVATTSASAQKLASLTPRERAVMEHAARGLHAKEIAAALNISPRTVEVHKTRIMAKLGVRNVAELVRFAIASKPAGPEGTPDISKQ
jgi:FixJ family two-component response regulator